MAIAFGSIGAVETTDDNTVAYPSGISAGDGLLLFIAYVSTVSTPSGWTLIGSFNDSGGSGSRAYAFFKTAAGSESGNLTLTGGLAASAVMVRYTCGAGSTWLVAGDGGPDGDGYNTSLSSTMGSDPGLVAGDVAVVFTAHDTNQATNAYSAQSISATGISAWGSFTERVDQNGTYYRGCVFDGAVVTGTSSAAPIVTATYTSNATGPTYLVRLREVLPPAEIGDPMGVMGFFGI